MADDVHLLTGHALVRIYPIPSGWRGQCECLEEFRGIFRDVVMDSWMAHRDEVAEEE